MSARIVFFVVTTAGIFFAGCSVPISEQRCRAMQRQGTVISSLEACQHCYEQLGSEDPSVIQGCALSLDASRIFAQ